MIIFSDGCGYQNVNITMSNALTFYYKTTGKTVVQKCLTKRHTQIEVDFVRRLIEYILKKKQVSSPAGYVTVMLEAKTSNPYYVNKVFHIFKVLKGQLYYNAKLVNYGHVLAKCQNNNGCTPYLTFIYHVLPFPS